MIKQELIPLITCSVPITAHLLHLSHLTKYQCFYAVGSSGEAQCSFTDDIRIHARKECGNSINECNLVLIAAV